MNWRAYGPSAILLEVPLPQAHALAEDSTALEHLSILEVTPAVSSTLLEFRPGTNLPATVEALLSHLRNHPPAPASEPCLHELPVRYDGEDLDEACRKTGFARSEFIRRHSAPTYTVAMLGFAPGFAYLDGLDPLLHMPRRHSPRTRVPRGSIAIGGSHTGVYSIPSPGGWNLLGSTPVSLFLPANPGTSAFVLKPGDLVHFVPQE